MLNDQSSLSPGGTVRLSGDIHSVNLEPRMLSLSCSILLFGSD
jgi:hypothetical protein